MTSPCSPTPEQITERPWTLDEAFHYCERLTSTHYENFPVGSRFIPKKLRPYVHSIYAFARIADDYADEPKYLDNLRLAFLENWEGQLLQCMWRKPQHPVFIALQETILKFDLPVGLFQDLLMAFKMDVTTKRHNRFEDLLTYCRYSANPVGRLVLILFGYRDAERHALSDSICTALQLTNFWQDVAIDDQKDRIYLPLEDMAKFGYSVADLKDRRCNEAFRVLMRHEIARTRELFQLGYPLCEQVGRALRFELRLVWNGGMSILDRIEAADYNVFARRPELTTRDKLILIAKTAVKTLTRRAGRLLTMPIDETHAAHRDSSFAFSFLFLPRPKREAIQRVYAFCRALDDVSDSPRMTDEKKRQLEFWRLELASCYTGQPSHPITKALQETIREFHLSRTPFEELLQGVKMDLTISRYKDFVHLSQYCYRVAGTVGLICIEIFGCPKGPCQDYAVALGIAFQITNILRDVKEDAERGRIYLPLDDLRRFGYTEAELMAHTYDERFVKLMQFQTERAADYFRRASDLIRPEYRQKLAAPEIMAAIYFALLKKIKAVQYNVFEHPIGLSKAHKLSRAVWTAISNSIGIGRSNTL